MYFLGRPTTQAQLREAWIFSTLLSHEATFWLNSNHSYLSTRLVSKRIRKEQTFSSRFCQGSMTTSWNTPLYTYDNGCPAIYTQLLKRKFNDCIPYESTYSYVNDNIIRKESREELVIITVLLVINYSINKIAS